MAQAEPAPDEVEAVDEQPQRRRQWTGPWRSVVLPILAVIAIAAAIFLLQRWSAGGFSTAQGSTGSLGIVPLPADKNPNHLKPQAKKGGLAPDFVLNTNDGGTLRLSDLRSHPVIINFWATWCGPCRAEMPQFETVYEATRDVGLVIVAVNVQESPQKVKEWANQYGLSFPVALDPGGTVTKAYRVNGLPMTLFIDRDGTVKEIHHGQLDRQALLGGVAQIL